MNRAYLVVVLMLATAWAATVRAAPARDDATPFCWDDGAAQQHRFICGENCGG